MTGEHIPTHEPEHVRLLRGLLEVGSVRAKNAKPVVILQRTFLD